MAHDPATIIREKVRAAEQIPMHWEKEQVWKGIKRVPGHNRKPLFYYAAATIVLAASLVVYFMNRMESEQSQQRIKKLEAAIHDHLKPQHPKATTSFPMDQDCETVSRGNLPAAPKVRGSRKSAPAEFTPIASVSPPAEEQVVVVASETEVADLAVQPEQVTDQPKIQAIIGFVPPPQEKITVTKVRKIKFRLFRENDLPQNERFAGESATFITARIN